MTPKCFYLSSRIVPNLLAYWVLALTNLHVIVVVTGQGQDNDC